MKVSTILATNITSDPRWHRVLIRDTSADDTFYYSVKTTGVYCLPSCASRPANVQFHNTIEDAESAGFRPCKRCKPNQSALLEQHAEGITKICCLIEASEKSISLETLADKAGFSVYYFHRVFKAATGLTPKAYFVAHRAKRVRTTLSKNKTVTEAIYAAGYNANSRFYEKSNHILGMKPVDFRAGGKNVEIWFALGESSLGAILVAASAIGVCAIFLGDDPEKLVQDLQDFFPKAHLLGGDSEFEQMVAKVVAFVEVPAIGLDLPLDVRGTVFQQRVWQALRDIPLGKTMSYTEIAKCIGAPKAVRAVASACAANKLALAIPCHRVVRSDGVLSGYRWGIARKRALLALESKNNGSI